MLIALLIALLNTLSSGTADGPGWDRAVIKVAKTIKARECLEHVKILASEEFAGRGCGEEGGRRAGEYMAARFEEAGLAPGGVDGSYFQPFSVRMRKQREGPLEHSNRMVYRDERRKKKKTRAASYGRDFLPHALSRDGWATGRAVHGDTGDGPQIRLILASMLQDDRTQLTALAKSGVRGAVVLEDRAGERLDTTLWPVDDSQTALDLVVVRLSARESARLMRALGTSLSVLQESTPIEFEKSWLTLEVSRKGYIYGRGRNVVGVYRGSDPVLRDEAIVIGAHYDHIGYARDPRLTYGTPGEIHNGADDNGSGSAGLIELAEAFAESGLEIPRTLVFVAFDAEELGLVGSFHYVSAPTMPLKKTVAMINMDMISRNDPRQMKVCQVQKFAGLNDIVRRVADRVKVTLDPTGMAEYLERSDHWPFIQAEIPAIFIWGGQHPEYHTENDDVDRINPTKISDIAKLMFFAAYECANHRGTFATQP